MVVKKSFKLLVATGTIPFFAFVSIISVEGCRSLLTLVCIPKEGCNLGFYLVDFSKWGY